MSPFMADTVAKVFLRHGSQILRGAGAAIEQRCGGPRRHTPNSQAIPAAGLRLYRAAFVGCFVLWREFSSCGFRDFCNTIGTFETCRLHRAMSASLIGRLGSSAFRPSAITVSMSLAGSCFSSESAPVSAPPQVRHPGPSSSADTPHRLARWPANGGAGC